MILDRCNHKPDYHDSCTLCKGKRSIPTSSDFIVAWVTRNLPFTIFYTSFGVWSRDHYMPLQRFTMGHMPGLAKAVHNTIALLRFPEVVCNTTTPLAPCELGRVTMPITHSSEQDTPPTSFLISKQTVPYQTRGNTCCPGVSTSKTQSLADLSMTNHKLWRSQPSPPFQTTSSNLTTVTSHHDRWKTNTLNTQQKPTSTS
jgi:hypothetical protein